MPENKKAGIDDYLAAGGDPQGALDQLISSATLAAELPATNDGIRLRVAKLAQLSEFDYELERVSAAKELGVRPTALDRERLKLRDANSASAENAGDITFAAEAVDGELLIAELGAYFSRYAILPFHAEIVLGLWTIHTWALAASDYTPRLYIKSPEPECGKTLVLELLASVVRQPHMSESMTVATIFRRIAATRPTLCIDEVDTWIRDNEELRGVLDSGFKADGSVDRCVGDEHEPTSFSTFSPVAMAGIGRLTPTLAKRSIEISMRRKLASESRPRTLLRKLQREGKSLAARCARWAKDHEKALTDAVEAHASAERPETFEFFKGLENLSGREWDKWEPLIVIADEIGAAWGDKARAAARAFSGAQSQTSSYKTLLLRDVRTLFATTGAEQLSMKYICHLLAGMEERPWATWGKDRVPITTNALSPILRDYGVSAITVWMTYQPDIKHHNAGLKDGGKPKESAKGYKAADLRDVFARYLADNSSTNDPAADHVGESAPDSANISASGSFPEIPGHESGSHAPNGKVDLFASQADRGLTAKNEQFSYADNGPDSLPRNSAADEAPAVRNSQNDDDGEDF